VERPRSNRVEHPRQGHRAGDQPAVGPREPAQGRISNAHLVAGGHGVSLVRLDKARLTEWLESSSNLGWRTAGADAVNARELAQSCVAGIGAGRAHSLSVVVVTVVGVKPGGELRNHEDREHESGNQCTCQ
jgi:hypothetical protein